MYGPRTASATTTASDDGLRGLVAVLDALGAKDYTRDEVRAYLKSKNLLISILKSLIADHFKRIREDQLKIFTFNDTITITCLTDQEPDLDDVQSFGHLLRLFMMFSLLRGIRFRGSASAGSFHIVSEAENAVMGPAVSEAATWYERADWIGIIATPKATAWIQSLLDQSIGTLEQVFIDYDVPLKKPGPESRSLKAVNWPKALYTTTFEEQSRVVPRFSALSQREKMLALLDRSRAPAGTESKYRHAVDFFDFVQASQRLDELFAPKPSEEFAG